MVDLLGADGSQAKRTEEGRKMRTANFSDPIFLTIIFLFREEERTPVFKNPATLWPQMNTDEHRLTKRPIA
jgi:hypothetical protein